jgi:hypothetical protein
MTFFYDLNKRLSQLAAKQDAKQLTESAAVAEKADYSAKKAAAGQDIGKPGKMFSKIAKSAGKEYGSKAAGERVAGAVLNKLRAKESVEEAEVDESALQAYIGDKKYGKAGMDALRKAGRDGASKDKMSQIRNRYNKMDEADMEEGNEFSGELAQARASGAKQFKVDGKSYPVKEEGGTPMTAKQKSFAKLAPPTDKITFADKIAGAKKEVDEMLGDVAAEAMKKAVTGRLAGNSEVDEGYADMDAYLKQREKEKGTGKFDKRERTLPSGMKATTYTRKHKDDEDDNDDSKSDQAEKYASPKKKGRPKSAAPKDSERVTKGSHKYKTVDGKRVKKEKTKEDLDTDGVMMNKASNMSSESADPADRGEYDREGDMAKEQMHTIMSAAKELHRILRDDENLPEWVQKKITLAKEYIDTARDYMLTQHAERAEEQPIAEKAVSKKQQRFMGMVHAAKKGERPASGAVAKVAKGMGKKDAEDFAATKHKGLPEKVKKQDESVEETADAPTEKKAKSGYNFGGGVYESLDRQFAQALTEGMNVSVNMSTGEDGQARKNITVSADGEDADKLAELLKMAGLGGQDHAGSCPSCGTSPCGCAEQVDENQPDWPTNTETSDDALQYSGGLNKPKSTGQTTVPVVASQLRRQASMEEGVTLERTLFNTWKNYKAQ